MALAHAAAPGIYGPLPLEKPFQREVLRQAEGLGRDFERLGLVVTEGPYAQWIERVGARLAPEPTDPYIDYRFSLLRDPTPNAFALADGHVYVHTGTLPWLQNEAQLEALLAHELAHVAGHHGLISSRVASRREVRAAVVSGVLLPWAGLATNLVEFGQGAVNRLALSTYSRELEREADDWGVELLERKGRDATAMVALFEQLGRSVAQRGERGVTLGRSHPKLRHRVSALQARSGPASAQAVRADLEYARFVAPLAVQTMAAYVDANQLRLAVELGATMVGRLPHDPAVRVAAGDAWQALGPLQGSPDGALTRSERRRHQRELRRRTRAERHARALSISEGQINLARHLAEAESQYRRALALDPTTAGAWEGLGRVLAQRGDAVAAAKAYQEYLRLAPQASGAARVRARVQGVGDGLAANQGRAVKQVVVLPPLVTALERRIGVDMVRPEVTDAYGRSAVAQSAAALRAAGYRVRTVSRAELQADPVLYELAMTSYRRFATVRGVLSRRRGGVVSGRYVLGDAAVDLAQQLQTDGLVFQQVDVTAAAWGQLARAMTLSTLTFIFRDIAGAGRTDLVLVDGLHGNVVAHHHAGSRVIGKRALKTPDVAAVLTKAALRDLRAPTAHDRGAVERQPSP